VLALTDNATVAIEGILNGSSVPDEAGIRITATAPSDGNAPSDLGLSLAENPGDSDQVIDQGGARVFVSPPIADFLDDKVLDARTDDQGVGFVISPQAD
jgi:Fe-S cluster assembly iron-binding protein IscA